MSDDDSVKLLSRWKDGDQAAASELFDRYVNRLVELARTKLSRPMQRRVEPEDVVQSAYRSFFRKAGEEKYTLRRSGDLWKLLATITVTKLRGQVEFHTAKKRGVYSEESTAREGEDSQYRLCPEAIAEEPTPQDALAVVEQLQVVMKDLDVVQRQILELALQNHDIDEISDQVQRSGRTVRRTLQQIREDLEGKLLNNEDPQSS